MSYRSPALGCLLNLAGLDAIAACGNAFHGTIDLRPHVLQIRKESSWCPIVSMTHMVAGHRFFAAHCTHFCHLITPSEKFKVTLLNIVRKQKRGKAILSER